MKVEVQLCTTAIPNSRGEKRLAPVTLCGFAYPLFSILERESLSLSVSPFSLSFSLVRIHTIVARRRRRRRSFSRPPFTLSRTVFHRSSFDSILPAERTRLPPPPAISSPFALSSAVLYLSISAPLPLRCPPRKPSRTQSPSAFITRYEIARASSRFTHTYLSTYLPCSLLPCRLLSGHDAVAIYIGKLCECRIMPDYASPAISFFLTGSTVLGQPSYRERERCTFLLLFAFLSQWKSSRNSYFIRYEDSKCRTKVSDSFNHRFFG